MPRVSQAEAVATIEEGHARVGELLSGLNDDQIERPATIGGGDWSAKDLIAHLATWERFAVETIREWRRGEEPWIERAAFSAPATGKVDALNARFVEENRARSLVEVRAEADRIHAELVELVRSMPDDEWNSRAFYETSMGRRNRLSTLIGSLLGAPGRPFGHAFAHLADLEAYAASARRS